MQRLSRRTGLPAAPGCAVLVAVPAAAARSSVGDTAHEPTTDHLGDGCFGDCGSQKTTFIHHLDPDDIEASLANVVFEFAPEPGP